MRFRDLFSRVKTVEPDEGRKWVAERPPDSYTLLDVRQPEEYERGHIPGAVLIPLPELEERIGEIDPEKPVLAY